MEQASDEEVKSIKAVKCLCQHESSGAGPRTSISAMHTAMHLLSN